jgi:hypothetical protein
MIVSSLPVEHLGQPEEIALAVLSLIINPYRILNPVIKD